MSIYSEVDPAILLAPSTTTSAAERRISLCEVLDRILYKGVVVSGEVVISVADIELIYLNARVLLTSVETACRKRQSPTAMATA